MLLLHSHPAQLIYSIVDTYNKHEYDEMLHKCCLSFTDGGESNKKTPSKILQVCSSCLYQLVIIQVFSPGTGDRIC